MTDVVLGSRSDCLIEGGEKEMLTRDSGKSSDSWVVNVNQEELCTGLDG